MPNLFTPIQIKDLEIKNRIVTSPMCEYSSDDGFANDWHLVHLGTRAVGGAGIVFSEAAAVSPEGRITYADLGIWKDEHLQKLQQITAFIRANNAVPGIQLAHAGRKGSRDKPWNGGKQFPSDHENGWKAVAPSAVAFTDGEEAPIELDRKGIEKVKTDFRDAAGRSLKVGFQIIEIHAAHGYLLHEFFSPLSNQREDKYGGSFENRVRLLLEVTSCVKEVWPSNLPIFVRISASDWTEGGWDLESSIKLSALLREMDVDLIDCSSGGNAPKAKIPLKPGYQVEFAARIKKEASIKTGAVGLITEAAQANEIVTTGEADLVFFARQMLRDPYFPYRAAHLLGHDDDLLWPKQYERGKWPVK